MVRMCVQPRFWTYTFASLCVTAGDMLHDGVHVRSVYFNMKGEGKGGLQDVCTVMFTSVNLRWMQIRVYLNSTFTRTTGCVILEEVWSGTKLHMTAFKCFNKQKQNDVPRMARSLLAASSRSHWWSNEAEWIRGRCLLLLRQYKFTDN